MSPVHDPRFSDSHRQSLLDGARTDANAANKWLYYTPLIMLGCGLLVSAMIAGAEGGLVVAAMSIPINLIAVGVMSVIGLIAMFVVCALFKSDAGPVPLGLLRLAGVYGVILPIATLMAPTMCIGVVITGLILAGLIAMVFDMEMVEGVVFAVVSWLVLMGINMVLAVVIA